MAGKIGRHIKKISGGTYRISKIFALDPAAPGFEKTDHSTIDHLEGFSPIKASDADYVQVIHTDSGTLGMQFRVGTIGII